MNNLAIAIIISTAIASCSAIVITEKMATAKLTPLERCLNTANSTDGKERCVKAFSK